MVPVPPVIVFVWSRAIVLWRRPLRMRIENAKRLPIPIRLTRYVQTRMMGSLQSEKPESSLKERT